MMCAQQINPQTQSQENVRPPAELTVPVHFLLLTCWSDGVKP